MKLLLTLAAIVLVIWLIRSARRRNAEPDQPDQPGTPHERGSSDTTPLKMLQCAHCGVHLPRTDAVAGRSGSYCTAEHRQRAED